ncbi:TatD DNase family protein [Clostridium collagenovorans DSM 3089]|uniref:TatD DNase family protein n=1 Tax=Clostridium collagenovorans DSM 3089 TaxID=1121306 RepID=A0A1M5W7D5_9CLOT|nr:TatD family hydrolase [Clostridium collagenovorans]SHH83103.1 TatD DNase family protein [Clostridium collagenovorans DSM 3089]
MIFDSHAHYDDESFNEDREEVLKELKENGIIGILNCGASMQGTIDSVKLANKYEFIYAAVGIHPSDALDLTEKNIAKIKEFTKDPKVKAIGEIGLDYYWEENPSHDIQKDAFRKQMELAKELKLPVVIHDRDAHGDTLEIMKEYPEVTGVVHCFSGSVEFARECIKMGYYIGIGGVVTFKNAKKVVEVVEEIPLNRLIVETDAPYMAPTPYRGKRNRSDYIAYVIDKISEIKNLSQNDLESITIKNTKELFKI